MTVIGILFLFIAIDFFDYNEGDWFSNLLFSGMFVFGLLAVFSFPYLVFAKKKVLVFNLTAKSITMSDFLNKEDTDFNKSIPLIEIKKFYYKKKVRWGGFSEVVNGLFYLDVGGQEKLFLDLTLPEVKMEEKSIEKILQFVKEGTRRA